MGWSYAMDTSFGKKEQIARFRSSSFFSSEYKLITDRVVGNHYWHLLEGPNGRKEIGLCLMSGGGRKMGWGYKCIDENMGPSAVDCPLSLLDMADEPKDYAIEWRKSVREFHAKKKSKSTPSAGMIVKLANEEYRLDSKCFNARKGWQVTRISDGCHFRMPTKHLSKALMSVVTTEESSI